MIELEIDLELDDVSDRDVALIEEQKSEFQGPKGASRAVASYGDGGCDDNACDEHCDDGGCEDVCRCGYPPRIPEISEEREVSLF